MHFGDVLDFGHDQNMDDILSIVTYNTFFYFRFGAEVLISHAASCKCVIFMTVQVFCHFLQ